MLALNPVNQLGESSCGNLTRRTAECDVGLGGTRPIDSPEITENLLDASSKSAGASGNWRSGI
jgi:hypothetical protein